MAPATYETLAVLLAASEALAGGRVRPQLEKKTDAVAILLRDRALVLLGFALGRRGSELARVDLEHIEWRPAGLLVKIPYLKTNKSGEPEVIGVPKFVGDPLCPVAALAAWVHYAKITAGPVFVTLAAGKGEADRAPGHLAPARGDRVQGRAARRLAKPLPAARLGDVGRGGRRRVVAHAALDRLEERCDVRGLRRSLGQDRPIAAPRPVSALVSLTSVFKFTSLPTFVSGASHASHTLRPGLTLSELSELSGARPTALGYAE